MLLATKCVGWVTRTVLSFFVIGLIVKVRIIKVKGISLYAVFKKIIARIVVFILVTKLIK